MKASDIVALAKDEIGYIGKKNATDNLYTKDAQNGVGKWNKYASDLDALGLYTDGGYYNGRKNGYDWCCVFVDWLFWMCAGKNKDEAVKVRPISVGGCGAGVFYAHEAYPAYMRGNEPKVGAQVFYREVGGLAHTGIVVAVHDNGTFDTVEGNWQNMVSLRQGVRVGASYNGQTVNDFCYPNYEAEEQTEEQSTNLADIVPETLLDYAREIESWLNEGYSATLIKKAEDIDRYLGYLWGMYNTETAFDNYVADLEKSKIIDALRGDVAEDVWEFVYQRLVSGGVDLIYSILDSDVE